MKIAALRVKLGKALSDFDPYMKVSFQAPNDCAKFLPILFKIATAGQTDASDLIMCPLLCYSNGTDNHYYIVDNNTFCSLFEQLVMAKTTAA